MRSPDMRFAICIFPLLLLCRCAPLPGLAVAPHADAVPARERPRTITPPVISAVPLEAAHATVSTFAGITFEGVAFDSRSHRLLVVDQAEGPGSRFADAASAGASHGGIAATNAGFFTPEGTPLGLVISGGQRSGAWNSASSLGSGMWHEDAVGRSAISRRETLGKSGAARMRDLLQAGPMLIENGHAVVGLDPIKSSVRTLLLWDGGSRWWLGQASPCTLAAMGEALSKSQPAGWRGHHALNLDGGRSSDLWISSKVENGPVLRRLAWNRPVRNFLVLTAR